VPVKAGVRHVGLTFLRSDALAETLPGAGRGGGGGGGAAAATAYLDLRLDGGRLKLYQVPETQKGREINELDIAGPYAITGPGDSPSRRRIFVCRPSSSGEEEPCAGKILSVLGRRAFRRPFTATDLATLLTFYEEGRKEGGFDQ